MLVQSKQKIYTFEWLFQEYEGESAIVSFASVEVKMSMSDIYELVVFEMLEHCQVPI